jgi:hypothetical protein
MATMFDTAVSAIPDFDFDSSSKSSILMCDVPFLEEPSCDLPFRANNADVPDDLLACTPIHGWDTPPDSPVHCAQLDSFSDPLISTKVGMLFDSIDDCTDLSSVSEKLTAMDGSEPVFDWTPPASPLPTNDCDDFMANFPPDLHAFTMPNVESESDDEMKEEEGMSLKPSLKRKNCSAADKDERKRSRDKMEAERMQRTAECDKAVKELNNTKTDDDPESRRHTHNVLERKRRNDLKNSYQQLREELPSLEDNERAPTGQILLHAVDFVKMLKKDEDDLLAGIAAAKAENDRLKKILGRKY